MNNKAFTLIEMLVVIGIIGVLLAILLPALHLSKEKAKSVYCRNNLKQMTMAAAVYYSDQEGYFPLSQYSVIAGSQSPSSNSLKDDDSVVQQTMMYYAWDFTKQMDGREEQILSGLLWQGENVDEVQKCPSWREDDNLLGIPYSGYNYNTSYIGHGQDEKVHPSMFKGAVLPHPSLPFSTIVMPAKYNMIRTPGQCVLFGDGQYAGGANKFMRSPWHWEGDIDLLIRQAGTQGYRHAGWTNVAWCDGHVTTQEELYTECHPMIQTQLIQYNEQNKIKVGFLSPDNRLYDLK